jgi:two-component system sensor histidine kinase KdpD
MARTISEQSQKMVGLMNNLLDMARLQAGVVTLNRQWNALEELTGSALRLLSKALEGARWRPASPPTCRYCGSTRAAGAGAGQPGGERHQVFPAGSAIAIAPCRDSDGRPRSRSA